MNNIGLYKSNKLVRRKMEDFIIVFYVGMIVFGFYCLVTEPLEKVQKDFEERSYKAKGRIKQGQQKHDYLVKEFLKCGHCGNVFGARRNKIKYYNHYYI